MLNNLSIRSVTAILLLTVFSISANAHSGGLNSQGCHAGSKPYHCHRSASEMVRSNSGGNRLRCNAGSRSKDCRGSAKVRYSTSEIIEVQYLLARHCGSIRSDFVDGVWGQQSKSTLRRFQSSYGLQADGIIGPQTLAALRGYVSGRCD